MSKKRKAISIVIVIAIIGGFYFYFIQKNKEYLAINTFQECVNAGYGIMETYPERCRAGAHIFINGDQKALDTPVTIAPVGKESLIKVDDIQENQLIKSPLVINGSAIGTWYFEASFPIELLDGNGKQIFAGPVQAKGDWMTTDFVPFSVVVTFDRPFTSKGTLILHKNNPSGEPSRDDSLVIPVRFI